jgi:hypothetical protein
MVRCGAMEGTFGLKLGRELRVCKPPDVGGIVSQNRKWKSRSILSRDMRRQNLIFDAVLQMPQDQAD